MASYKFNQGVAGGNNAGITLPCDLTPHARNALVYNFAMTGSTSNLAAAAAAAAPAAPSPVVLRAPTCGASTPPAYRPSFLRVLFTSLSPQVTSQGWAAAAVVDLATGECSASNISRARRIA